MPDIVLPALSLRNRIRWRLFWKPRMNWRIARDLRARRRGVQRYVLLNVPFPREQLADLQEDPDFRAEGYRFSRCAQPEFIRVHATSRSDLMEFVAEYVVSYDRAEISDEERDAALAVYKREIVRLPRGRAPRSVTLTPPFRLRPLTRWEAVRYAVCGRFRVRRHMRRHA